MAKECCTTISSTNEEEDIFFQINGHNILDEDMIRQDSELGIETQEQTSYINPNRPALAFQVFYSLRRHKVLCDIKLETDDGTIIYGHKVILASASAYFHTMFTNFEESKKEHIILKEMDSTALELLVDFIYTSRIVVTKDNVQDLLHASSFIQLDNVKEACYDFLLTHLDPTNCLGYRELVSLYGCMELLSSFESYIQQHFFEVVEGDEFLCLPYEQVVEFISRNMLNVASEEKVFECVINWMNHNSDCKKDVFFELMEHVRLPLISREYLLKKVKEIPLFKNSLKYRNYIMEALNSNIIPSTISTKLRLPLDLNRILLVVGYRAMNKRYLYAEWYDPVTNNWHMGPEINLKLLEARISVLIDGSLFLFDCGYSPPQRIIKVEKLDLFSSSAGLEGVVSSIKYRRLPPGVCVFDNCIYTVGGLNQDKFVLRDGEVFNLCTNKRQIISKMSIPRCSLGVGVLDNHLYVIGGFNVIYDMTHQKLRSVERYCPTKDTWTKVAEMSEFRSDVGVGVLNGIIYVVGGLGISRVLNSVEAYNPRTNVWTVVSSMHKYRKNPKVVPLGGLLYVVGGDDEASIEIYNPKSDIWSMLSATMHGIKIPIGAHVFIESPNFN